MRTMTKTRQRKMSGPARAMSDPTTWATDPATMIPDVTRPNAAGGERVSSNGLTPIASIAANECRPAGMAGGATVATPTEPPLTNGGDERPNPADGGRLTLHSTKRQSTVTPTVTHCEQCGAEFVAHRPWARFCGAYCRRRAWLDRNPERAAELHERDIARLRAHVIGNGGEWIEGGKVR